MLTNTKFFLGDRFGRGLLPVIGIIVVGLTVALVIANRAGFRRQAAELKEAPAVEATDAKDVDEPSLSQTQREQLWQIEHRGLILNRKGFPAIADALSRGDRSGLVQIFAQGFKGEILADSTALQVSTPSATARRIKDVGQAHIILDAEQFADHLFELRRPFTQPPKVQLSLMNLAPEKYEDFSTAWHGTCQLRMSGEMGPGRPGEVMLNLSYQLREPAEDLFAKAGWLEACAIVQSQVAQSPRSLMRDVTAERGINPSLFHDNWVDDPPRLMNTGGVYLCDFDHDGYLDLLITDVKRYVLYKGLPGGKFVEVTSKMGLLTAPASEAKAELMAAFVDIDGDGWEDLILGSRIYRNEGGKRFVDYTAKTNLRFAYDAGGIAVADFDRDGKMDLYIYHAGIPKAASWLDGSSGDPRGNQLLRNLGNWQFEDVTSKANAGGGSRSTFSAVWFDADNDGWPDLYVINEFGNGVLLLNQRDGKFKEKLLAQGPADFGSMGVTCGDLHGEGNIDLYVANMYSKAGARVISNILPGTYSDKIMSTMRQFVAGSQLWRNKGGGEFEPLGKQYGVAAIGWAYGAALVDLDNDGWLDIYATAGFISQSRSEPDG
jgi:hypothetical protein